MSPLLFVLGYFFISVICHVMVHQLLLRMGIVTFKSIFIFIIGFFICIYLIFGPLSDVLPNKSYLSILLVYVILSIDYIMLIASPYLGDEGPSSKITFLAEKYGMVSRREILNEFSDQLLVDKRLQDLIRSGLIRKKSGHYLISPKGKLMINTINFYRVLLRWNLLG